MNEYPAFQFYPVDWLCSIRVAALPLAAEGAYIRLLCHCWMYGSIPANMDMLVNIIGKNCSMELAKTVAAMFDPHPSVQGELIHPKLEEQRTPL